MADNSLTVAGALADRRRRLIGTLSLVAWAIGVWEAACPIYGNETVDWLSPTLEVGRKAVVEIDPQTGEELELERLVATLFLEGVREDYLYSIEGSDDLSTWVPLDRFYGGTGDAIVERPLDSIDAVFIRVRLTPAPSIPAPEGFAAIEAGSFLMGSPETELGRGSDESLREVTLSRGFYISETEVYWNEWLDTLVWALDNGYEDLGMGANGREGDESGDHPVTTVSWWDAVKWCNARSEREGRIPVYYTSVDLEAQSVLRKGTSELYADWEASGYRLPTEAEWEYACRADSTTAFHLGPLTNVGISPVDTNLDTVGWYGGNSENATHPVKGKQANLWGLFDMHGNVREWCWDWYGAYGGVAIDPKGPDVGSARVFRGGSWGEASEHCRSANRDGFNPSAATDNYGFRLVLNAKP